MWNLCWFSVRGRGGLSENLKKLSVLGILRILNELDLIWSIFWILIIVERKGILQLVRLLDVNFFVMSKSRLYLERNDKDVWLGEIVRSRIVRLRMDRWREKDDERENEMGVFNIAISKIMGVLLSGLFLVFIRNSILDGQLYNLDWWIRLSNCGLSKLDVIRWSLMFGICIIGWEVELTAID